MDALVTVRFRLKNACNLDDLEHPETDFEELVRWIIKEEGLVGIVEDDYEILGIEEDQQSALG